jgi:putative transposase
VAPNLLNQCFDADIPNQKWVGDITYLWTEEGWLYLAVIIDLYSRAVVGWSMSERMTAKLACDALKMALQRRKKPRDIIVHTDSKNVGVSFHHHACCFARPVRSLMQ